MKQVVCWKVLFYMWNFLIKLDKEFYKKWPFWHHDTRWQKKKYNYSCDNFIGNNLRIHEHSIRPASFFQKWNQILQKDNCFKNKIAKICAFH